MVYWKISMRAGIDATNRGWRVRDEKLEPIMMTNVSETNVSDIPNKLHMSLNFLIH